ncbi:MAG: 2,3-diphosphoglycerate-dependent phosphoglycerate mutase [Bacteroidales bacterium]|nr:2,3-diphosphoglycerate-dependent phosphoglycerate mutase [Bacteroidales bacterium]
MLKLVLIRHGESVWNKENRFTGWTDVGLTAGGVAEARQAGKALLENNFHFVVAYTSYLTRAIKTLWLILEEMDLLWIPVYKRWRLNEKHYGNLQGLNKKETAEKFGEEQVLIWRRSFDIPPPPLSGDDPRHPMHDPRYAGISPGLLPATESLKDTVERMLPLWKDEISEALKEHREVLVAAHGNSLRAVVQYLKQMSKEEILKFNIPTGIPYVFEFDDDMNLLRDYFVGDPETIKALQEKVANQGKK